MMPIIHEDVRRLATLETLTSIQPILGADSIVQAKVRGWKVVVKKGEFHEGDLVIYFEVDTALPLTDPRFTFLAPRGSTRVEDADYHVLRTMKLRGIYSQGLVLPLHDFPELSGTSVQGADVTSILGVGKWEAPLPSGGEDIIGPFLTQFASKTDSERAQNLTGVWATIMEHEWVATEKVDGTSATFARDIDGKIRVMGRNWEIEEGNNIYWNLLATYPELVDHLNPGDAVQCEIVGPGIQGNRLGLKHIRPVVFDLWRTHQIVPRSQWPHTLTALAAPAIDLPFPKNAEDAVGQVDKLTTVVGAPGRQLEGIVWHTKNGQTLPELEDRSTWKALNNSYLLKHGN